MNRRLLTLLGLMAISVPGFGQRTVVLPPLTITGSSLTVTNTYDAARGVYRYEYTVTAPASNKADIGCWSIDLLGLTQHQQIDPELGENIRREPVLQVQPLTTVPVGVTVPNPGHAMVMFGKKGKLSVCGRAGISDIKPGTSSGVVIESKFPPGIRKATLEPSRLAWEEIVEASGEDDDFDVLEDVEYDITTMVIGPTEYAEADYFSGGGQQPAEVNKFLRYVQPKENRVKVPAGTSSYNVIIFYGNTINPATFVATLNGVDITSKFRPIPGSGEVVNIALGPGTTKLQMEVVGTKSSGATARDSDTLTFLPQ
ncbi:MAG TPA: hypothetical protein VNL91_09885 [Thermoanaerobaculia bacterium]|nr:hypothetical protein [Thermoanaerobaculia bacterium]